MIIRLSQVSKLIGVPMGRSEHFITHIVGEFSADRRNPPPTLAMGVLAIASCGASGKQAKLLGVNAGRGDDALSWSIGF